MAKWIGYLGGGAAGAAVAVAGYVAWTLYPDPGSGAGAVRETPAALAKPETGQGAAEVPSEPSASVRPGADATRAAEVAPVPAEVTPETAPVADRQSEVDPAPERAVVQERVAAPDSSADAETGTGFATPEQAGDPAADTAVVQERAPEADTAGDADMANAPDTPVRAADPAGDTALAEAISPAPETHAVQGDAGNPITQETAGAEQDTAAQDTAKQDTAAQDTAEQDTAARDITEQDTAAQDTAKQGTATTETDAAASGLLPPTFDLVRIEPDGAAIVAGAGSASAQVRIFLDGGEIGAATSGRDGRFVSLLQIPPSRQPRLLTLAMSTAEEEVFSKTEIIVAPFGAVDKPASEPRASEGPTAEPDRVASPREERPVAGAARDTAAAEPGTIPADAGTDAEVRTAEGTDGARIVSQPPAATEDTVETSGAEAPEAEASDTEIAAAPDASAPVAAPAETGAEAGQATAGKATAETDRAERRGAAADESQALASVQTDDAEAGSAAPEVVDAAPLPAPPAAPADTETPDSDIAANAPDSGPREAAPVLPDPQAPPRLLASDDAGVRVLPGPEVLDRVAIDSISYDTEGEVALAGRGVAGESGGFVRVYLDNTPITTSRIRSDRSWQVTLPEIDRGVYTLRVDEVDAAGEVKSRAETPFLREDRETLEEASEATADGGPVKIVTVQPGNTLWQIARERYGEGILYVRVFDANKGQIRDPDLIYPGQVFDLPEEGAAE